MAMTSAERQRAYRARHPERVKERNREAATARRAADPDAYNASMRAYNATHREVINERAMDAYYDLKERRSEDPELDAHCKELAHGRNTRFNARHPERVKASHNNYKAKEGSIEKINTNRRARYAKDPTKAQAYNAKRFALRRGSSVNTLTAAEWEAIKIFHKHCCVYCGKKQTRLTQDHITPLSKGGTHTLHNVVPACRSCNAKKGAGSVLIPIQPLLLI
jgi:5-methylcytosine-specific restriction endonuclease McrA